MPFVFDATTKGMVELRTGDYVDFLHLPKNCPNLVLNVDLSTLSAATDVAIGFGDPLEEIADLNFQAGPDAQFPDRCMLYNAALRYRYGVPVRSIVILLRPKADHANLTGILTYGQGNTRVEFRYEVIRVWEHPAEFFLSAGLGIAPLAVLGILPDNQSEIDAIRSIVERIEARLLAETTPENAARLMSAAFHLTSLRIPRSELGTIYRGVGLMKAAYDELLEEGGIKQLRKTLLGLARRRFGSPSAEIESEFLAINDLDRLDRMGETILDAKNWVEFLETQ